ncbi:MAG: ATP-dependent Clp protease adaptor ClpS [Legionellales bacterium RIFCSPHIGHO2_12_FULL_35_11]|nr:MAG: ATP-dependent Clp protease adaptor ClpS [Legionellales bacterium RIFCSPHIGHO2_12_FULL_35_11]
MGHRIEVDERTAISPKSSAVTQLSEPKKYKIFLLNDDYTPMDFVVHVLQKFFYMNAEVATRIMLEVHRQGRGLCGIFSRDVAETKVVLVNDFARLNQYPLLCNMERE